MEKTNKTTHTARSLEERKAIVTELFKEFREKYPSFFKESYSILPTPKSPPSLKAVDLSQKKMAKVPIDNLQKSVLCGTCLADGSLRIQPKYKNARIQNRHSTRQAEWFFWKWMVCLKNFTQGINSVVLQNPDGFQKVSPPFACLKAFAKANAFRHVASQSTGDKMLGKLRISSKADDKLTALHSVICEKNKEKIERSWLNHMTDYFLMTVWLDDGSLFNERQGEICLDSTPLDQQKIFLDYLKTVWGIEAYTYERKEKRMANGKFPYRIRIKDTDNLLKLLRIVAPIVPVETMLFKVMFVPFNNTDLLQRWASEITELVKPEFRDYVREFYKKKLQP